MEHSINLKQNLPSQPKVLVIGSTGLLGSRFIQSSQAILNIQTVSRGQSSDYQGDFSSFTFANEVLQSFNPDWIINFAAVTNVDLCEEDPHSAYLTHVKINENISHHLRLSNCQALTISTDHVYDKPPHELSSESEINLRNTYALTKLFGEAVYSRDRSIHLRTNFFGKSANHRKSFTDWLFDSLKDQKKIKLFSDVFFSPLSIKTLVNEMLHIIKNPQYGVFNLGSMNPLSKAEFAMKFANELKMNFNDPEICESSTFAFKAKRPTNMSMNVNKFVSTFNRQLPTLESEIKLCAKEYNESI